MPTQTNDDAGGVRLPWEELADAHAEADEAIRGDDTERQRAALAEIMRCREACGQLGGLLIMLALDHAGLEVQRRLSQVFGGLSQAAWDRASSARKRATHATDEMDALKQRIRELERRLDEIACRDEEPPILKLRAA